MTEGAETAAAGVRPNPFPNFMEMAPRIPRGLWAVARLLVLAATGGVLWLLATQPALGLPLFWKVMVPSLPAVFALAPGLWRNVCPMAFVNQMPRLAGFGLERALPSWAKSGAVLIAILLFFVFVGLRHPLLNHEPLAVIGMVSGALILAFAGGVVFKGRSGWCGTFCPLGPIQKVYGHTAPLLVRNGYCDPCLGCQKNCYDFNPRAAVFSDLYDRDRWYADNRRFFFAALPGLVLAFFTAPPPASGLAAHVAAMLAPPLLAAGLYQFLALVLRVSAYKLSAVFGLTAFALFYWFGAPVMHDGVREVFGFALPAWSVAALRAAAIAVALGIFARGLILERAYGEAVEGGTSARVGGGAEALRRRVEAAAENAIAVTERSTGRRIEVPRETTLLEALEAAELPIEPGCRMGVCGADPVCIVEGGESLPPPGEDERATLRRLGLEGKARLACSCRVTAPITVDLTAKPDEMIAAAQPAAASPVARTGRRIVIIGNGIAGITVAEQLRQGDPDCQIDLISRERYHFYNRMGLGRVVFGRTAMGGLYLMPESWYAERDINVWLNTLVVSVDRAAHTVHLGTQETLPYDKLVLAMGAQAFMPPIAGIHLPGSFVLREAEDALRMREWSQINRCRSAVVLGGGVLGVEAAESLRQLGLEVTLVHNAEWLMNRQLDQTAGDILRRFLEGLGIDVACNTTVTALHGEGRVEEVELATGDQIVAGMFLVCAGVRPHVALAREAGLAVGNGILVDDRMRTSDPDIYAVGDVAELPNTVSGLWPVGIAQAKVAAAGILGRDATYSGIAAPVYLKVNGIDVKSFGRIEAEGDGHEAIVHLDPSGTRYRKILIDGGRVAGGVFVNEGQAARIVGAARDQGRDVTALLPAWRKGDFG